MNRSRRNRSQQGRSQQTINQPEQDSHITGTGIQRVRISYENTGGYETVGIDAVQCLRYHTPTQPEPVTETLQISYRHTNKQLEPDPQIPEIGAGIMAYMDAHLIQSTQPNQQGARVIANADEDDHTEEDAQ